LAASPSSRAATALVAAVVLGATAPARAQAPPGQEPAVYAVGQAPPRLAASIAEAEAAIAALQRRLSGRLLAELQAGGLARAIAVCRTEAPALTAETAREEGIRVGRTSHRLRNPKNAAPAWAERLVAAGAGRRAAAVEPSVVDLGDRVGVLRPIATIAMCVRCHGRVEILPTDVKAFLDREYPDDRATGFEEGDLRGFAWAEAPLGTGAPPAPPGR
jgi:hypothetical protein